MTLDYCIMSGAGNVFSVIDNRRYGFSVEDGRLLAPRLCHAAPDRPTEGLMLIAPSTAAGEHFRMEFFNPDGSHGAMCGNGSRCAVRFAAGEGMIPAGADPIVFSVLDAVYTARLRGSGVAVHFPPPRSVRFPHLLSIGETTVETGYVDVGSDHLVLWYDDIAALTGGEFGTFDIATWGARLRHHSDFAPRGVNVNFYRLDDGSLRLRTFERGVEAETGACGTGAISTALIAARRHGLSMPVRLVPTSGRPLSVHAPADGDAGIELEGDAVIEQWRTFSLPEIHPAGPAQQRVQER